MSTVPIYEIRLPSPYKSTLDVYRKFPTCSADFSALITQLRRQPPKPFEKTYAGRGFAVHDEDPIRISAKCGGTIRLRLKGFVVEIYSFEISPLNDPDSYFHKGDSRAILEPSSFKVSHNEQYGEQYMTTQGNQPPDFYEPFHPGIDLTLLFRERDLTVEAVASECRIDASKLHEIVDGNIDLDDDTINRLTAIFDPEIIASIRDVRTIYEHDLKSARSTYTPRFS